MECDFADEDENPDSLTNCYVEICATGVLAETLQKHGCGSNLKVDAFNVAYGHSLLHKEFVQQQHRSAETASLVHEIAPELMQ